MTKTKFFTLSVALALTVATPTLTPNGGSFTDLVSVAIQTATPGASIYYTTDGSIPTQSSTRYTGPMALTANTTLYAQAFLSGSTPSAAAAATFNKSSTTSGRTFYVATNGSDSNSCAQAMNTQAPKRNIMGANGGLACLVAGNGDTLDIRAGTYTEQINSSFFKFPSGTSYANAATIKAHTGETVIISPPTNGGIAIEGSASYLVFQDLVIDGTLCGTSCDALTWVGNGGHHIRFINLEVRNANCNLNSINRDGSYVEFIGGKFHDTVRNNCNGKFASGSGYAFYIDGTNNLVEYAKIYNIAGYGIHNYSGYGSQYASRNTYRFNEISATGQDTSVSFFAGILLGTGSDNRAYGNIVKNNTGGGIGTGNAAINSAIYNNTVIDNSAAGISWSNQSGAIIRNNILSGNGQDFVAHLNTPVTLSNNLCAKAGTGCAIVGNP